MIVELVLATPWSEVVAALEDVLVVKSVVRVLTNGEVGIDEGVDLVLDVGMGDAAGEKVVVDVLLSWRYWRGFSVSSAKHRLAKRRKRANMLRWNILKC